MAKVLIRHIALFFGGIILIHLLLSSFHPRYSEATRLTSLTSSNSWFSNWGWGKKLVYTPYGKGSGQTRKANATFIVLARNSDVDGIVKSLEEIDRRFNAEAGYPYTFLNDEAFTDEFIEKVKKTTKAPVEFGQIPTEHWVQPTWINETLAAENREQYAKDNIIYGGSVPYRNMCRFNSGFFFRHPLTLKYKYYWRVEPGIRYHCDIPYDPFLFMQDNKKVYGWTMTLVDIEVTIKSLWDTVKDYLTMNPYVLDPNNALQHISDNQGDSYNTCHFWSNFEIADMDFFRSKAYMEYFDHLDRAGGFYYERWGDAPVHSVAIGLMLNKDQVHYFEDIGYQHDSWINCPVDEKVYKARRCECDREDSFVNNYWSCMGRWQKTIGK